MPMTRGRLMASAALGCAVALLTQASATAFANGALVRSSAASATSATSSAHEPRPTSETRQPSRGAKPAAAIAHKPDFNADGYADLAIGSPMGAVAGHTRAGRVSVVYGGPAGLDKT